MFTRKGTVEAEPQSETWVIDDQENLTLGDLPPAEQRRITDYIEASQKEIRGGVIRPNGHVERHKAGDPHPDGPWLVSWEAHLSPTGSLKHLHIGEGGLTIDGETDV